MTFGLYSVQYNYCDFSRKYININLGLPGGHRDRDNMMGMWIGRVTAEGSGNGDSDGGDQIVYHVISSTGSSTAQCYE